MKVIAQTLQIECNCSGQMYDSRNGSFMITSDTMEIICEECGKTVSMNSSKLPKRATLFV